MSKALVPILALLAFMAMGAPASAATNHFWQITSPDHAQTFAYGTETNRVWKQWGSHLALLLDYTNDPYVDYNFPRQYDNFRFDFPNVFLGADGRTFYYRTTDGRRIPVATKRPDLFGIDEVKLLPNASVAVRLPSGYITVFLNVFDVDGLARR